MNENKRVNRLQDLISDLNKNREDFIEHMNKNRELMRLLQLKIKKLIDKS